MNCPEDTVCLGAHAEGGPEGSLVELLCLARRRALRRDGAKGAFLLSVEHDLLPRQAIVSSRACSDLPRQAQDNQKEGWTRVLLAVVPKVVAQHLEAFVPGASTGLGAAFKYDVLSNDNGFLPYPDNNHSVFAQVLRIA
jgi:hypothetical protein